MNLLLHALNKLIYELFQLSGKSRKENAHKRETYALVSIW